MPQRTHAQTRSRPATGAEERQPCLPEVVDADVRVRLLREAGLDVVAAPSSYIRWKPGVGTLVGLDLEVRDGTGAVSRLPAYIRHQSKERTAELAAKWHSGRTVPTALGPGVRVLGDGCSVLFLFPNDARVRGMRWIADKEKLKRILGEFGEYRDAGWRVRGTYSHLEVVRYKPERRLIVSATFGLRNDATGEKTERDVFLRFFADPRGAAIARLQDELAAQAIGAHLPRAIGSALDGRLFVEERVQGEPLPGAMRSGRVEPVAVAEVLARLHDAQAGELAARPAAALLAGVEESVRTLSTVAPGLAPGLAAVEARLRSAAPRAGESVTVHGDCHLDQFLVAADRVVVVDFERAARGDAMLDLGRLCAHLEVLQLDEPETAAQLATFRRGLEEGYCRQRPDADTATLPFYTALGVFEAALLAFRQLQDDWQERCRVLLERALAILPQSTPARERFFAGGGSWAVYVPRSGKPWPGWNEDADGTRRYAVYDPATDCSHEVDPAADDQLPALAGWLSRGGELLAYRPQRRATLRAEVDGAARIIKVVEPRRAADIAATMRVAADVIGAAPAGSPCVPRLLEVDPETGVLEMEVLAGGALRDQLRQGLSAGLDVVAASLAALHSVPVASGVLQASRQHGPLEQWAGHLAAHDGQLFRRALRTVDACASLPRGPFGPADRVVHGDLHDGNILIDSASGQVSLIDLDQIGAGDPTEDLGNLAAHVVLRALQNGRGLAVGRDEAAELHAAYVRHGGVAGTDAVAVVAARTLVRLGCVYRFRRRWQHLCAAMFEAAEGLAAEGRVAGGSA